MRLKNGTVIALKGLDIELLTRMMQREDIVVTARHTANGWIGSLIVDDVKTTPMMITRKKYRTKEQAIEVLLDGIGRL